MPFPAQTDGRNPDNPAFLRRPHKAPPTDIGVLFAGLSAKPAEIATTCAFPPLLKGGHSRRDLAADVQRSCSASPRLLFDLVQKRT